MADNNKPVPMRRVQFDGDTYEIPIVVKGNKLGQGQREQVAWVVCEMYATDKYSLDECLKNVGIGSRATWAKWGRENEQIKRLYDEAKEIKYTIYYERIVERGRTMLEKHIDGYIETTTDRRGIPDEKNPSKVITTDIIEKQHHVKPNFRALQFALQKLDKNIFGNGDVIQPKLNEYDEWTDEQLAEEIARLSDGSIEG